MELKIIERQGSRKHTVLGMNSCFGPALMTLGLLSDGGSVIGVLGASLTHSDWSVVEPSQT